MTKQTNSYSSSFSDLKPSTNTLEKMSKQFCAGFYCVDIEQNCYCQCQRHCVIFTLEHFLSHRTHMQDLKDMTNDIHYENYRCGKLAAMTVGSPTSQPNSK